MTLKSALWEMLLSGLSLPWLMEAADLTGMVGPGQLWWPVWSSQQPMGCKRAWWSLSPRLHDHLPNLRYHQTGRSQRKAFGSQGHSYVSGRPQLEFRILRVHSGCAQGHASDNGDSLCLCRPHHVLPTLLSASPLTPCHHPQGRAWRSHFILKSRLLTVNSSTSLFWDRAGPWQSPGPTSCFTEKQSKG